MNKKILYIIIAVIVIIVVVGGLIWYLTTQRIKVSTIDSDTIIGGDYTIEEDERTVVRNGSILTVKGNLTIEGEISCEEGPLNVVVEGDLTVNSKLTCNRPEAELAEGDIGAGISLAVAGSVDFSKDSEIVTNGHIQIVDNQDNLAKTKEEIDEVFEEVVKKGPNWALILGIIAAVIVIGVVVYFALKKKKK